MKCKDCPLLGRHGNSGWYTCYGGHGGWVKKDRVCALETAVAEIEADYKKALRVANKELLNRDEKLKKQKVLSAARGK